MPFLNVFCESYNWWWKYWDICLLEGGWDAYFLPAWKEKRISLASFFIKLPGVGVPRGCRAWRCMKQWRLWKPPTLAFPTFLCFYGFPKRFHEELTLFRKDFWVPIMYRHCWGHWGGTEQNWPKRTNPSALIALNILTFQRPRLPEFQAQFRVWGAESKAWCGSFIYTDRRLQATNAFLKALFLFGKKIICVW